MCVLTTQYVRIHNALMTKWNFILFLKSHRIYLAHFLSFDCIVQEIREQLFLVVFFTHNFDLQDILVHNFERLKT